MPSYQKCSGLKEGKVLIELALRVMAERDRHQPLLDHAVTVEFLFAYPKYDDADQPVGNAITHQGVKALGLAKIVNLKDRVKGCKDAEILIDWEWWKAHDEEQQKAVLDHELTHLKVQVSKTGALKTDDLGRPKLTMRKHDIQFGWFNCVALDNGVASIERTQATMIVEVFGQIYFPFLQQWQATAEQAAEVAARVVRGGV
jgi:hypothetical protein